MPDSNTAMTTGGEEPGEPNGQRLEDIVRDGDEYYDGLRRRYLDETRLHVAVVSVVVWFVVFAVLGLGAITTVRGGWWTSTSPPFWSRS